MNRTQKQKIQEQQAQAKAYQDYADSFTPKPACLSNSIKAFFCGGTICVVALWLQTLLIGQGLSDPDARAVVTILLIAVAQLLTGIGVFDTIAKFAGAGVIVPITGFANAMVAPAIEFKKEGPVLGIGSKLFSIAGPVLVCGISVSVLIGLLFRILDQGGFIA